MNNRKVFLCNKIQLHAKNNLVLYSYISKLWICYALHVIIIVHCFSSDFVRHLRHRCVGRDGRCQVRADIVLREPSLFVVFSILQCMMNYIVEFSCVSPIFFYYKSSNDFYCLATNLCRLHHHMDSRNK